MMERREVLASALAFGAAAGLTAPAAGRLRRGTPADDRAYMVDLFTRIADPVLGRMAKGELHARFTPEVPPNWDNRNLQVAYLEAFGRLASGIAPWLSLADDTGAEGRTRQRLRDQLLQSYVNSVDPASPDLILWQGEPQILVDSAYYANAFLRAPALWQALDTRTQARIVERLQGTRVIAPLYTNWTLFSAMIEAFLLSIGEQWDPMRIDLTIRKINEWYVGDGWYADGPRFHFDYYGSYVIHAMLVEILEVVVARKAEFNRYSPLPAADLLAQAYKRMQRFGEHLERLVGPDGFFAPFGRSVTYRTAAFQPLGLLAWRKKLPDTLTEGGVRAMLTAAQHRIFDQPGNFGAEGYLTLGFAGHQPTISDHYSNAGSMYLVAESFIALGLPADDSYWTTPAQDWTARKAYSGQPFRRDYYVDY